MTTQEISSARSTLMEVAAGLIEAAGFEYIENTGAVNPESAEKVEEILCRAISDLQLCRRSIAGKDTDEDSLAVSRMKKLLKENENLREQNSELFTQLKNNCKCEERHRVMSSAALDGIVIYENNRIIDINEQMLEIFGYEYDEMIDKDILSLSHASSVDIMRENIIEKKETPFEILGHKKDGSTFFAKLLIRDIKYNDKIVSLLTVRDYTGPRQIEQNLIHKIKEMQAIFLAFPDLYFRLGTDGKIHDFLSGHTLDKNSPSRRFIGKRLRDILPGNIVSQFLDAIERCINKNSMVSLEYSLPSQVEQIFEARFLPFIEKQAVVIIRNISRFKRAERALKQIENRYQWSIDSNKDLIVYLDAARKVTYANQVFYEKMRAKKENIAGRLFDSILAAAGEYEDGLSIMLDVPLRADREHRSACLDGSRWISWQEYPMRDQQENIIGTLCVGRDITEFRIMSNLLHCEKSKLSSILENTGEAIVFIDENNIVTEANDNFVKFAGSCAIDCAGKSIDELDRQCFNFDFRKTVIEALLEQIEVIRGRLTHEQDKTLTTEQAVTIGQVRIIIRPRYINGRYTGLVINIADITELHRAKKEAESMSFQAQSAGRISGELHNKLQEAASEVERIKSYSSELRKELAKAIDLKAHSIIASSVRISQSSSSTQRTAESVRIKDDAGVLLNIAKTISGKNDIAIFKAKDTGSLIEEYNLERTGRENQKILYISHHRENIEFIQEKFAKLGHAITVATSAAEAISFAQEEKFDLIIIKPDNTELKDFNIAAKIRKIEKCLNIPIIAIADNKKEEDLMLVEFDACIAEEEIEDYVSRLAGV